MPSWERAAIAAAAIVATLVLAKLVDLRLSRRQLAPEAATRYRVLRRSIVAGIVVFGVLSALLVVPQVRAIAGGILASGAVVAIVVGFAAQQTLSNFISGLLIAFSQPLRLGDRVTVGGEEGVVEEIGLTYTFIRTRDQARLVIPNSKLASDTIRNATIVSREKLAQITVQVPLDKDLGRVVDLLREETAGDPRADVLVTALNDVATVTVRASADDPAAAERLESHLRVRALARLREAGVLA
ncbi:MAG: mechanosensitive ion channel family protein [Gaiellaceae bacterium]